MYVDFILTESPPDVDDLKKIVILGGVSDGSFIFPAFPASITFGGHIEISFDEGEDGIFEVEIIAEPLDGDSPRAIHNALLEIPPADQDWPIPRVWAVPFQVDLQADDEVDFVLSVWVNDDYQSERAVVLRKSPAT